MTLIGHGILCSMRARLLDVFGRLLAAHGPRRWWPGAETPFEVVVGAILTQNTAWVNVEKALDRLRAAGALSVEQMRVLPEPELAELLRPSGYFNTKARKLKAFIKMLDTDHGGSLERLLALPMEELRARLLATWGIGPETADDIVLYAAGLPSFVVDAYTARVFTRLGIVPVPTPGARNAERPPGYEDWRRMFMQHLPPDAPLFNEYHALIVAHGNQTCRPTPRCSGCPLIEICPSGNG
jgi:endonuclease III related protein